LPPGHILVLVRDVTKYKQAEQQAGRQLEHLAALRSIDLAITSNLDLQGMLSNVLSQVTSQLKIDAADILLLAVPQRMLEYAAGVGFRSNALQYTRLPIGEGYAGLAALQQQMISIPDLPQRGGGFLRSPNFTGEEFACYFGVPLISKGQARGVLELFHRAPLDPDPEWLEYMQILSGQAAIAIDNAMLFNQLQDMNRELSEAYDIVIEGWSRALDLRDRDTEGHTQRVTEMALDLARHLSVDDVGLVHIRRGAILHDIGKMAIPDSILLKPASLTAPEWEVMRQHPRYARELLAPMPFLAPAIDIPHYHHEKWDGTGYPDGLKGDAIPLIARLFAVVDVFDALTSDRPYRPAWTRQAAVEYIRAQAGSHFDPDIAGDFLKMIDARS
jgi:HD-GYP domain-containing protein (c-di-GMP phosphodiesterase class II)